MNIKVNENRLIEFSDEEQGTSNESNILKLQIEIPEKYQDFYKKIVFVTDEESFWDYLEEDGSYKLKNNVTKNNIVNFYIWLTKDNQDFRSKTYPLYFYENESPNGEIPEEQETEMERVVRILEEEIDKVEDLEEEAIPLIEEMKEATEWYEDIRPTFESVLENVEKINEFDERIGQNEEDIEDINNTLPTFSLITETGNKIDLAINPNTYVLIAKLYDKENRLISTSSEIDLPLETMVVGASYDNTTKEIVLTLKNGNTVRFSVADLVSGLQSEITSTNKLSSDLVDDSTATNKFVSQSQKNKLDRIESNAQVNIIEDIKVNGTSLQITNKSVDVSVPTKTSDINNDSGFIDKDVNNLTNYVVKTDVGTIVELTMNNNTYVMTLNLKNNAGTVISTAYVDLPLEEMIVGVSYDNTTKDIVITLKSGTVTRVPVGDLVDGLVSQGDFDTEIERIDDEQEEQNTNIEALQEENATLKNIINNIYNLEETLPTVSAVDVTEATLNETMEKAPVKQFDLKGNTYQEVIEAVEGTTVSATDIEISDYDDSKESKFTMLSGNTEQNSYIGSNYFDKSRAVAILLSTKQNILLENVQGLKTGLTYTAYANGKGYLIVREYDSQENIVATFGGNNANSTLVNFNLSSEDNHINMQFYTGTTDVDVNTYDFSNVMIVEGNYTLETLPNYEPYVGGQTSPNPDYPQDIRVVTGDNNIKIENKNLFNANTVEQGSILADGSIQASPDYFYSDFIKKNNVMVISWKNEITDGYIKIALYDKNKQFIERALAGRLESDIRSFIYSNNNSNITYIKISMSTSVTDVQVEKQELTNYNPHQEQNYPISLGNIELCKIGNYADYIYKKYDGNWYKHSEIGKSIVNINNISFDDTYDNIKYIRIPKPNDSIYYGNYNNRGNSIFSNLIYKGNAGSWENLDNINKVLVNGSSSLFFIGTDKTNTLEEAQSMLENTSYYYPLAIPVDIPITDSTLITQLNAIAEATGYEDTMYITSTNTTSGADNLAIVTTYHYNYVTPAPSPDRPSDIEVVTGENNIKFKNKNILKFNYKKNNNIVYSNSSILIKNPTSYLYADFNKDEINKLNESVRVTIIANGKVTSGTVRVRVMVTGNAYALLCDMPAGEYNNFTKAITIDLSTVDLTFITTELLSSPVTCDLNVTVQIEKGSTTTPYVEHQEQNYSLSLGNIEILEIGSHKDKIVGTPNNWKIPNKSQKISNYNGETITTEYISTTGGLDTGATVYYVGSTDYTITDSTLIEQLNNLYNNMKSYNDQTNVSQTNDELPFTLDITMLKKLT